MSEPTEENVKSWQINEIQQGLAEAKNEDFVSEGEVRAMFVRLSQPSHGK